MSESLITADLGSPRFSDLLALSFVGPSLDDCLGKGESPVYV